MPDLPDPLGAAPSPQSTSLPMPPGLDDELEGKNDNLSALDPFVVMQKKPGIPGAAPSTPPQPSPAATPPPPPPPIPSSAPAPPTPAAPTPSPTYDREALLRQAAEAPPTTLKLPENPPPVSVTPPPVATPPPAATPPPPPPPAPPKPPFPPATPTPTPPVPSVPPKSEPPKPPVKPTPPATPSKSPGVQVSMSAADMAKASSSKKKAPVGIIAVLGLLIALLILAGGGYVMAMNGSRIPFIYPLVSGLSSNGVKVSQQSAQVVASRAKYQQTGEVSISAKQPTAKPDLPSGGDVIGSGESTKIEVIKSKIDVVEHLTKTKAFSTSIRVAADTNTEVPVTIQNDPSATPPVWKAYFKANTQDKYFKVTEESLHKTLLYPALRPTVVSTLLEAVKAETAYETKKYGGRSVASHMYTLDSTKLKDMLPEDATIDQATAEIAYYWKNQLPAYANVKGVIKFKDAEYDYSAAWKYGNWDLELKLDEQTDIKALVESQEVANLSTGLAETFIAQLGIDPKSVPNNGLVEEEAPSTAIVPTGESISEPIAAIATIPPVPSSTVTEEMKTRDIQRKKDLGDLQTALEAYKAKNGNYPKTTAIEQTRDSAALFSALLPEFISKMPVDPLKDTYWYEYKSDGTTYQLRSVAENASDSIAKKGVAYYYYEFLSK